MSVKRVLAGFVSVACVALAFWTDAHAAPRRSPTPRPPSLGSPETSWDCAGIQNGRTVVTDCGCGKPASSTFLCRQCDDNTSCLDCRGIPFGNHQSHCGGVCMPPMGHCYAFGGWEGTRFGGHWAFNSNGWGGFILNDEVSMNQQNVRWCAGGGEICADPSIPWRCWTHDCPAGLDRGCFDPTASVLLSNGKVVSASEVKLGDRIYNPLSGRSFPVKKVTAGPETIPLVEIGFGENLLRITQTHPILTASGMKRAKEIKVGDVVIDASGGEQRVQYARLGELKAGQQVFNFELDVDSTDPRDRLIVADNIASGDLAVQNGKLPGEE